MLFNRPRNLALFVALIIAVLIIWPLIAGFVTELLWFDQLGYRSILMTSLTTCVGLAPMALGFLVGAEANAPLARAVIGGLMVSTALTLLLIPTLYTVLEERFPRSFAVAEGHGS